MGRAAAPEMKSTISMTRLWILAAVFTLISAAVILSFHPANPVQLDPPMPLR